MPASVCRPFLCDLKHDREVRKIVLCEEILYGPQRRGGDEATSVPIINAKILEEEDVLFSKVAVLQISDDCAIILDGETPKFISQIVFAVFDPVDNLSLRVLSFWKYCLAVDVQRRS